MSLCQIAQESVSTTPKRFPDVQVIAIWSGVGHFHLYLPTSRLSEFQNHPKFKATTQFGWRPSSWCVSWRLNKGIIIPFRAVLLNFKTTPSWSTLYSLFLVMLVHGSGTKLPTKSHLFVIFPDFRFRKIPTFLAWDCTNSQMNALVFLTGGDADAVYDFVDFVILIIVARWWF